MKKESVKLSKLELLVMRPFWENEEITIRDAATHLENSKDDPGYSTVQTIAGRLEKKRAIEKTQKIGKAWLFRASVERKKILSRMVDEIVALFGGGTNPILSHLVESEQITKEELDDIREMIEAKENTKD